MICAENVIETFTPIRYSLYKRLLNNLDFEKNTLDMHKTSVFTRLVLGDV